VPVELDVKDLVRARDGVRVVLRPDLQADASVAVLAWGAAVLTSTQCSTTSGGFATRLPRSTREAARWTASCARKGAEAVPRTQ
jgi:hypothetical protein